MTLNKGKLVLRGVNPVTVCFTDRPARLAGYMQTSKLGPLWSQGKDSFLKDNPNAALSVFHRDNVSNLVVELSNPQLSGNVLSYDVKVLEGTLLAKGARGTPSMPHSVASQISRPASACQPRSCSKKLAFLFIPASRPGARHPQIVSKLMLSKD